MKLLASGSAGSGTSRWCPVHDKQHRQPTMRALPGWYGSGFTRRRRSRGHVVTCPPGGLDPPAALVLGSPDA